MLIVTYKGKNRGGKVTTVSLKRILFCQKQVLLWHKTTYVGLRRNGTIPFLEVIVLSLAAENNLAVFKNECMLYLNGRTVLADKIYSDFSFFNENSYEEIKKRARSAQNRERKLPGHLLVSRIQGQRAYESFLTG